MKIPKALSESVIRRTDKHTDQAKRDKRTNNVLQNTMQKTKYRATRTPQKQGELKCSGRVNRKWTNSAGWFIVCFHTVRLCFIDEENENHRSSTTT